MKKDKGKITSEQVKTIKDDREKLVNSGKIVKK